MVLSRVKWYMYELFSNNSLSHELLLNQPPQVEYSVKRRGYPILGLKTVNGYYIISDIL